MMQAVERREFIHDVVERGNLESASNREIVSKVKSNFTGGYYSGGVTILSIVPEGYLITQEDIDNKKLLVELDSSSLVNLKIQQDIQCATSDASVIQMQMTYKTAVIAKQEYLEGTYLEETLAVEIEIEEAKESLTRLEQYLEYSQTLAEKGFITKLQLQADESAVRKAKNQLELALKKQEVLKEFKVKKMQIQLNADIKTAEARLKAEDASHKLDLQKRDLINEQIEHCTVYATEVGQVVYANNEGHHGRGEVIIEEGTIIRERQVIIKLPDPSQMQVEAKVSEGKISLVKTGMTVTIRLDAFPDVELEGKVIDVSAYPVGTGWFGTAVKEYETIIKILDPEDALPEGESLRPGLTAEVKIRVQRIEDALQVPVQAIIEHGSKLYCVLRDGNGVKRREVTISASNDKTVVIKSGLEEGELVVLNATAFRDEISLPELDPKKKSREARKKPADRPEPPRENEEDEPGPDDAGPSWMASPAEAFKAMDKNGDKRLEVGELVPSFRPQFSQADTSGDGALDLAEFSAAMAKLRPGDFSKDGPKPEDRR